MSEKTALCLCAAALLVFMKPSVAFSESVDHKLAGDEYLRKGFLPQAIAEYKEALAADPALTAAYFNLAIAYYHNGQLKKAAENLEILCELAPSDTEAIYNLACLKLYLGDVEGAQRHFEKADASRAGDSRFKALIENGFWFLRQLEQLNPQNRRFLFALLRQGVVPPLAPPGKTDAPNEYSIRRASSAERRDGTLGTSSQAYGWPNRDFQAAVKTQ